jgi:hypothetical protein
MVAVTKHASLFRKRVNNVQKSFRSFCIRYDATALVKTTRDITTLDVLDLNVALSMSIKCHYSDCHYADCHYADCRYADCHYADCHSADCPFAECCVA